MNGMRGFLFYATVVISLLGTPVVAAATMRACVDHYPPFQILSDETAPIGENIVALQLMATLLERQLVFIKSPNFARCIHMLEIGGVDVVAGLIAKPERANYSYFLPFRPDSRYVFISRQSLAEITTYDELNDLTIGVSRETQYFERFDADESLHKVVTNDVMSATNMLLRGRFDLLIVPEVVLPSLKRRYPQFVSQLMVHPYTFEAQRTIYFGVSKKHQLGLSLAVMQEKIEPAFRQSLFMKEIEDFVSEHIALY